MVVSIGSRGSHIPAMTLIAVNISLLYNYNVCKPDVLMATRRLRSLGGAHLEMTENEVG